MQHISSLCKKVAYHYFISNYLFAEYFVFKSSGRSQPSREDKVEFLHSLGESAAGHLTIPMLYFYKYLVKHGQQDGMPQIDKDLFFYIEVQKFKV